MERSKMIKNRRGLEIAEYIALAGAVTGTILATVLGQFTYAAWPLCLVLCLNVLNRRNVVNHNGDSRRTTIALEEKITRLESARIQSQEDLNQAIATLNNQAQNVDSMKALDSLVGAVQQLRSQQQQLHHSIKLIKDQLNTLTEQFKERPELEQIESLSTVIMALKKLIDDLDRSSSVD